MEKKYNYRKYINVPQKILKIYETDEDYGTYQQYYEIVRGNKNLRLEVWCTRWIGGKRNGHREYKLAWLEYLDGKKYINTDVCNSMGYTMRFFSSFYNVEDMLVETDRKEMPHFFSNWHNGYAILWKENELRKYKDFRYLTECPQKQVGYNYYKDLMSFLRKWKQYPITEMLIKMGFSYMINDKRFLSINDKNKKTWIKYLSKNRDIIITKNPDFNIINKAIKTNEDLITLINLKAFDKEKYDLDRIEKLIGAYDVYKLAKCVGTLSLGSYIDYISACKTLNVRYEIYPKDLKAVHDKYVTMLKVKKNEIKSEKINEISTCIESQFTNRKKPISINGLEIRLTHSFEDFEILGKELKCCVARCNYSNDMVEKHNLIILGIYKNDKPIECVELGVNNKKFNIKQCRGYENMPSQYHNDCMTMLQNFCKRFTYNYVF